MAHAAKQSTPPVKYERSAAGNALLNVICDDGIMPHVLEALTMAEGYIRVVEPKHARRHCQTLKSIRTAIQELTKD